MKLTQLTPLRLVKRSVRRMQRVPEVWRLARIVAAEHGLSTFWMLQEAVILRRRHSLSLRAYFKWRVFDPVLSREEKGRYMPGTYKAGGRLLSLLTPERYRCLYANKLVFKGFFSSLGFPLAKLYGVYDPAVGHTSDGRSLRNAAELGSWLQSCGGQGFVFKPVWGERGHQVLVLVGRATDDPNTFVTLSGERYDAERLIAFTQNTSGLKGSNRDINLHSYLIEERIRPHPELAEFIGPTLCSVRVVTIVALDGRPRIIGAVFKLQPKPIGVDHLLYGAVGCWVDLESGVLGRGRTRGDLAYTSVIPGTERSFVGFQLPYWAEVKDLALRAAAAFPWARAIGWDIAISDRGAVLVEGNPAWSLSLIQMPAPHGLMTGEFRALCEALANRKNG